MLGGYSKQFESDTSRENHKPQSLQCFIGKDTTMKYYLFLPCFVTVFIISSAAGGTTTSNRKLKEQYAIEGTSYKLKCPDMNFISGNTKENSTTAPEPYKVWSVNGRPPRGQKYKVLQDGLVIRNVSKEDTQNNYTCIVLDRKTFLPFRAENIVLKIREREAKSLDTKTFPSTEQEDKLKIWGILNQWKVLQCRVFSRPSPTFIWLNEKGEKIQAMPDLFKIAEDETTSNLTIYLHNTTFFGNYTCKASNIHGDSLQAFILAEGYKPKSPFLFPLLIGREKLAVKIQNQKPHNSGDDFLPVKTYFVQYAKLGSLKSVDEEEEMKSMSYNNDYKKKWETLSRNIEPGKTFPQTEIFEIKKLQPNTTYLLRSAVENEAAVSDFSSPIRITTDASPQNENDDSKNPTKPDEKKGRNREAYGRSADDNDVVSTGVEEKTTLKEKVDKKDGKCTRPKFRKTIIIKTTSTTLIESIDDSENSLGGNSSLVKKRIEEDTNIVKVDLCNLL